MNRFLLPLCSIFFLLVDFASKSYALHAIPLMRRFDQGYPFGGIPVFEDFFGISFSLNLAYNTGAAWGFFQGSAGLLFILRTGVIVGLLGYLLFAKKPLVTLIPLWLVVTGAIGNALDYLLYGHVIDFFHFVFWGYSFPIFNWADSLITLGVIGLVLFSPKKKQLVAL